MQVEPEGIEQDFLGGGGAAILLGFGDVEVLDDLRDAGEVARGFAAGGDVGGVVFPKCLDAATHVVTACFTVVHADRWLKFFCCGS